MTTRACVWKSGSLIAEIATFLLAAAWAYEESRKDSRRDAACRVFVGMIPRLDPLEYTYAEFQAKHKQRAHMKLNTARVWLGGIAGGVLSAFHADLDCLDIRDVDSDRASLRVGSRHRRPWTEDGSQNRDDRWILRRRTGQLRASSLVADSSPVAARMDARPMDRLDLSRGSRGLLIQRVNTH